MNGGGPATTDTERATLLLLNAEYLRAVERADRGWFEDHLGEDFLCSLPDGVLLDSPGSSPRCARPLRSRGSRRTR